MEILADVALSAFLAAVAWGGGALAPPLAVALCALGAVAAILAFLGRPLPPGVLALGIAVAGAHAVAAGGVPDSGAWLLTPAGAISAGSVLLVIAALLFAGHSRISRIREVGLAGAFSLALLAAVPAALAPLGFESASAHLWRPLVAAASVLLQGIAVLRLLTRATRRRSVLCAVALLACALVALLAPGHSPPLQPPARAPYAKR
jgi:hypothetical protein